MYVYVRVCVCARKRESERGGVREQLRSRTKFKTNITRQIRKNKH